MGQSEAHSHPAAWAQALWPHWTALFGQLTSLQVRTGWTRSFVAQQARVPDTSVQLLIWPTTALPPIYFPSLLWILLFVIFEMNL